MYLAVDLGDSIKVGPGHFDGTELAGFDLGCKINSSVPGSALELQPD